MVLTNTDMRRIRWQSTHAQHRRCPSCQHHTASTLPTLSVVSSNSFPNSSKFAVAAAAAGAAANPAHHHLQLHHRPSFPSSLSRLPSPTCTVVAAMATVPGQLVISRAPLISSSRTPRALPSRHRIALLHPVVNPPLRHASQSRLRIQASSSSSSAGSFDTPSNKDETADKKVPKEKQNATLQAIAGVAAIVGLGTLGGVALTLSQGGPAALMAAIAKSGFSAAFALIFVSEIGDKTFFIAALLAMRHSRVLVLLGATGALSLMTVISVIIGRIFQTVPAQLQTTLPIGEYAAVALLIWFGVRSIKAAWDTPSVQQVEEGSDSGELAEAQEFLDKSETKKVATPLEIVSEAFGLVFVAEWGDRSMLATVALGAAQSPWGVASGAIAGHVIATALAVLGGSFLAQYISEKVIGYTGGILFLVFAAATLIGVF